VDFIITVIKHVGQTKHCKASNDTLFLQKMFLGGHDRQKPKNVNSVQETFSLHAVTVITFRSYLISAYSNTEQKLKFHITLNLQWAMPWIRQLVASLSLWRPQFETKPVHV
jgi:hypothetical protein